MSREYLTIGPTPCDEVCHPANGDKKMQRIEMNAFKEQLTRVMNTEFGENLCVYFSIKSFPHDFGSYSEVCVIYDDEDQTQVQQAFWIESNTPESWDVEAEKYLKDNEYVSWSNQTGSIVEAFDTRDAIDEEITAWEELLARDEDGDLVDQIVDEHHRHPSYSEVMQQEDEPFDTTDSEHVPDEYCETCHVLGHGPNNCPSRLWINQPQGTRIEAEPKQHLLPGEVLNLVLPTGQKLEIERTADTYSVCIDDIVIYNAELDHGDWTITVPRIEFEV